jgi:hypothetical protein
VNLAGLTTRRRPLLADGPHVRPAGAWTWAAAAASLVLALTVLSSRYLWGDTYYDLYAGRYIAAHGIPQRNVVTVAASGTRWIDQQWLAHLSYYATWAAGGYPALAALSASLVTVGFAVLAFSMMGMGVPPARAFAWTLAAFICAAGSTWITAQSFGYPCLAGTLALLLADRRAPRLRARTWLVIPVLVLWANTHGSVLLGAGLVAGYAVARAIMGRGAGYLALGLAAAAAVFCTPYGFRIVAYYRSLVGNPQLMHNALEWSPPSLRNPVSWGFFAVAGAVAIAVAVGWRRGTRPDPWLVALAVILLALALTAVRNQVWFGFGGCLLAADTLARGGRAPDLSRLFRRGVAAGLAALALASLVLLAQTPDRQFDSLIPGRAIDVAAGLAARNPALRVLGDDWSGTALLWRYPTMFGRVGFDARLEQYSPRQLGAYFRFLTARGPRWPQVMRGYAIVVADRREHPALVAALRGLPGWRVAYSGPDGLVAERLG